MLVHFKMHNFCYSYDCLLYYSVFLPLKTGDFQKHCRSCFSLNAPGLHFSVNGPKRRFLKMMAWLPTFVLRIPNDHVIISCSSSSSCWHAFPVVCWVRKIVSEMQWKRQCRQVYFVHFKTGLKWKYTSVNRALVITKKKNIYIYIYIFFFFTFILCHQVCW